MSNLHTKWIAELNADGVLKFVDSKYVFCTACESTFEGKQKGQLRQHLSSTKHAKNVKLKKAKRSATQGQLEDCYRDEAKKAKNFDMNRELCTAMLAANIPWTKLQNPRLRKFLEARCAISLPDESTLRKSYLDICYQDALHEIRAELKDQPIWISADETTDTEGRFILNVVAGRLSDASPGKAYLVQSMVLEKTNAETVSRAVNDVVTKVIQVEPERVLLLLSDAAAYMLKCGMQLKVFYPNMIHVTCLAHALHRVCEAIRILFPKVNTLISSTKKVFLKAPSRVLAWKNANSDIPLPPDPVITRWGTWLNAAIYYANNLSAVRKVVFSFDPNDAGSIYECQDTLEDDELKSNLAYIAANLKFLPGTIECLERKNASLADSLATLESVGTALQALPGDIGSKIKVKFDDVMRRNPGISKLKEINAVLSGEGGSLEEMPVDIAIKYKFAPVTSVDVERSFSVYKSILCDNRRSLTTENVAKILVANCFYSNDN